MTHYLSLAEFWYLTEYVTGIDAATLMEASRVELPDSALHAPMFAVAAREVEETWLRERVTFRTRVVGHSVIAGRNGS